MRQAAPPIAGAVPGAVLRELPGTPPSQTTQFARLIARGLDRCGNKIRPQPEQDRNHPITISVSRGPRAVDTLRTGQTNDGLARHVSGCALPRDVVVGPMSENPYASAAECRCTRRLSDPT